MKIDWLRIPRKNFDETLKQGYSQSQTYIYYLSNISDSIIRIRKETRKTYTLEEILNLTLHSKNIETVGVSISDRNAVLFLKKEV